MLMIMPVPWFRIYYTGKLSILV